MKNLVEETTDPKIIEQTLRQLKNIEKVQKEIKRASLHKEMMCASESSRVLDNMFELGSDRASLPKAEFKAPGASGKKLTVSKKAEEVFGANNESMVTRDDISNQTKKMAPIEMKLRGSATKVTTSIAQKLRGSAAPKRIKKAEEKENLKRPRRSSTPFNANWGLLIIHL